jgi:hypothetical protein
MRMVKWKVPAEAKVYEAFGALADGRVELLPGNEARVVSSTGARSYRVRWDEQRRLFSSDDNASRWQGTIGYPISAVLLALGELPFDHGQAASLAGIPWKTLNDAARRNYAGVVKDVLPRLAAEGVDVGALQRAVQHAHVALAARDLERPGK